MPELAEEQIGAPVAEGPAAPGPSAPNVITLPSGEVVTLHPKVTLALGMAAMTISRLTSRDAIAASKPFTNTDTAIIEAGLSEVYLRFGVKEWTFRDAKGWPEPVTPENIERLLSYNGGGREVAEAADALYSGEVFRPFREAQATLLRLMQQDKPTSPPSGNGSKPRRPSRRSSPTSSAGKRSGGRGRSHGKRPT